MIILGINIYGHDTSAAIVVDGVVVAAIEEERLSRVKHDRSFPYMSVDYCLKKAGVSISDVDIVATTKDFDRLLKEKYLRYTLDNFPKANELFLEGIDNFRYISNIENEIRFGLGYDGKIIYPQHHLCHIASSYFLSGFQEAAALSADGLGEIESTVLGVVKNGKMEILESVNFPHSLGSLYAAFTYYLGFSQFAEGTVMALASFGNPNAVALSGKSYLEEFRNIVKLDENGCFEFDLDYFKYPFTRVGWVSQKTIEIFGPMRDKDGLIEQRHNDIAAALQIVFEDIYLHLLKRLHSLTGLKKLVLAGGCALNCAANGKIISNTGFDDIYIQPAASDSGTAIGAALLVYNAESQNGLVAIRKDDTYLGSDFTDDEIELSLKNSGLSYKKIDEPSKVAAQLLFEGKVLGWFQGRMEFGPRALGNRSILSAPFPLDKKDFVNQQVKHRESFRPFAPSVLKERAYEFFDMSCDSPFMLMAFPIHQDKLSVIPAVAHVDSTARVQTVSKETNLLYYELIKHFGELSGVPVVLDTSFNDKGEPIVCSPLDAIKTFRTTGLDAMIMGGYCIYKDIGKGACGL